MSFIQLDRLIARQRHLRLLAELRDMEAQDVLLRQLDCKSLWQAAKRLVKITHLRYRYDVVSSQCQAYYRKTEIA
jgi:hypothetical protein